ncbi:MAG: hypothetical protein NT154_11975 [Verrucomicrobia bacterium]|nr:hypothetical protein [Verrucomicrobiota bacterium]
MSNNVFESSDSVRSAKPLRYAQTVKLDQPLALELGGHLAEVAVTYEAYGELNAGCDNAVLVCHAISGDSHVARHDEQDDPGWWDILVGPGKAIDTSGGCWRNLASTNSWESSAVRSADTRR